MDETKKVLDALESWILRVADKNTKATPEELDALPKVAKVFLDGHLIRFG